MPANPKSKPVMRREQMIIWVAMAIAIFAYQYYTAKNEPPKVDDLPRPWASGTVSTTLPSASPTAQPRSTAVAKSSLIRNVTLRDQDGDVIYRGEIDLGSSLERVAAGRKLRFPNDGSTFQNREGRLPRKSSGYYEEWVVPTPGESGPGPQRLVVGADGDVWYTPDHYRTFERIPSGLPAAITGSR